MIIAIDQSTSATKALLFDDNCKLLKQVGIPHKQYYPQPGWVEHDAQEIWQNTLKAIREACNSHSSLFTLHFSLRILIVCIGKRLIFDVRPQFAYRFLREIR